MARLEWEIDDMPSIGVIKDDRASKDCKYGSKTEIRVDWLASGKRWEKIGSGEELM